MQTGILSIMELSKYTIQRRPDSPTALAVLEYSITVTKNLWGLTYTRTYYRNSLSCCWENVLGLPVDDELNENLNQLFPIKIENS